VKDLFNFVTHLLSLLVEAGCSLSFTQEVMGVVTEPRFGVVALGGRGWVAWPVSRSSYSFWTVGTWSSGRCGKAAILGEHLTDFKAHTNQYSASLFVISKTAPCDQAMKRSTWLLEHVMLPLSPSRAGSWQNQICLFHNSLMIVAGQALEDILVTASVKWGVGDGDGGVCGGGGRDTRLVSENKKWQVVP
jgi:hypothetical protein